MIRYQSASVQPYEGLVSATRHCDVHDGRILAGPIDRASTMSHVSSTAGRWSVARARAASDSAAKARSVRGNRPRRILHDGERRRVGARVAPRAIKKRKEEENPEWAKHWIDGEMPDGVDRELEAALLEVLDRRKDELQDPLGPIHRGAHEGGAAEDTPFPKNPNPLELPPLPDLRELAEMSNLNLTDEEIEDFTQKCTAS